AREATGHRALIACPLAIVHQAAQIPNLPRRQEYGQCAPRWLCVQKSNRGSASLSDFQSERATRVLLHKLPRVGSSVPPGGEGRPYRLRTIVSRPRSTYRRPAADQTLSG